MNLDEAIEILKNNFPKTCKMVDGRYKGGFDDTECEFGQALLLSISTLEEIKQYRTIGTVEECREARERQSAKKPILYGDFEDGKLLCPNCEEDLMDLAECGFDCCPYCGQKLDLNE